AARGRAAAGRDEGHGDELDAHGSHLLQPPQAHDLENGEGQHGQRHRGHREIADQCQRPNSITATLPSTQAALSATAASVSARLTVARAAFQKSAAAYTASSAPITRAIAG